MKKFIYGFIVTLVFSSSLFATEPVPGNSFNAKMRWLDANAQTGGNYLVEIDMDQSLAPMVFSYGNRKNINIIFKDIGQKVKINQNANGTMFIIESGITLVLDGNIELQGGRINNASLIRVNSGGIFIMNDGKITNNNFSISGAPYGGGIYVAGSFTMNGGEITGNTSTNTFSSYSSSKSYGGGVYIDSNGNFTMNGGLIANNKTSSYETHYGGGVYVTKNGTFIMNGGKISNNDSQNGAGLFIDENGSFTMNNGEISANSNENSCKGGGLFVRGRFIMSNGIISKNIATYSNGGGVFVSDYGSFILRGGEISGNTSTSTSFGSRNFGGKGGGIYIEENARFIMEDGVISGNRADNGGGVFACSSIVFTMNNGKISANTAYRGGGLYLDSGRAFIINSGEISGNIVSSYGAGVYVNGGEFTKNGGIIFGYAENDRNSNIVRASSVIQKNRGHAVYINHSNGLYIMGMDAKADSNNKLSFNGVRNPPVFNGEWDF